MKITDLFKKIKKMRPADWKSLMMLTLSFVPGKIWKAAEEDIWVVSEYEMMARDNGYWFYKYLKEKHPEIKAYYPINSKSPDYEKIRALGGILKYGGIRHYCAFWAAKYYCSSSSVQGFPSPRICEDLVLMNIHRFKYVFLNHGITRGYSFIVNKQSTNYDAICTCSQKDKKIITEENGQPEGKVYVTGFARHDNLDAELLNSKLIVIMPTWREWLSYRNEFKASAIKETTELFLQSDYYKSYESLLNNTEFHSFLEENDMKAVFYLHQYAQVYADYFGTDSERITIGKSDQYDVQTLLKEAVLLITDYSSVCYDFSYMYKPVIYYQFDINDFEEKQYKSGGMFTYESDGFGEVCYTEGEVLDALRKARSRAFAMEKKYKERVDEYFAYSDKNNCERIFQMITDS